MKTRTHYIKHKANEIVMFGIPVAMAKRRRVIVSAVTLPVIQATRGGVEFVRPPHPGGVTGVSS